MLVPYEGRVINVVSGLLKETVLRGVVSSLPGRIWGSNCQGLAGGKKPSAEIKMIVRSLHLPGARG